MAEQTSRITIQATPNPFLHAECGRLGLENWGSSIYETYGQYNEDLILESFLRVYLFRVGRGFSQLKYIEIGANHPIQHSATYLFYRKYGARGVLVEPLARLCAQLERVRPGDVVVNATVSDKADDEVTLYVTSHDALSSMNRDHIDNFSDDGKNILNSINVRNIQVNKFFESYGSSGVDYLSVDTEGQDFNILNGLDMTRFRPAFIQCEPSGDVAPFIEMMRSRNYVLLAATEVNVIFADILALLGASVGNR